MPAAANWSRSRPSSAPSTAPTFPAWSRLAGSLQDLDRQKQAEDAKLVERFRSNWQTAVDREQLVRKSLAQATSEGMKLNEAATEYAVMRQEANASHDLYMRVLEKVEEAGLAAGVHGSNISVVDPARQPVKPVAPDLPLYLAITFFAGLWLAVGAALLPRIASQLPQHAPPPSLAWRCWPRARCLHAQAPTPSTSGLPTGVVNLPQSQETQAACPIPRKRPRSGTASRQLRACRRSPQRNPPRPCPRPSLPATFSTSASTTRRSFIPRSASPPPARSRCR